MSDPIDPDIGVAANDAAAGAPPAWQFLPLLLTQGLWVKRMTPRLPEAAGERGGIRGQGDPLSLLALGDSIIAGVGVSTMDEALPAQLAQALADQGQLRVRWRAVGKSGAASRRLLRLIDGLPEASPDLVLVNNGVNDVASPTPPAEANALRQAVIKSLEQRFPGAMIYQCGLPPMGHFPALPWPLRTLFGRRAAAFDLDLATWLQGRPRSRFLPFDELPSTLHFAEDGYHPDQHGVALWARKLATHLLATRTSGS